MNIFEQFKEYKMVNGNLIEDIELKTTKNNKEQITIGHINSEPVYVKKRFTKERPNIRTKKYKHHKPTNVPNRTRKYTLYKRRNNPYPTYKKRKTPRNPRVK